jgi:hypothetical protein
MEGRFWKTTSYKRESVMKLEGVRKVKIMLLSVSIGNGGNPSPSGEAKIGEM